MWFSTDGKDTYILCHVCFWCGREKGEEEEVSPYAPCEHCRSSLSPDEIIAIEISIDPTGLPSISEYIYPTGRFSVMKKMDIIKLSGIQTSNQNCICIDRSIFKVLYFKQNYIN